MSALLGPQEPAPEETVHFFPPTCVVQPLFTCTLLMQFFSPQPTLPAHLSPAGSDSKRHMRDQVKGNSKDQEMHHSLPLIKQLLTKLALFHNLARARGAMARGA